MVVVFKREVKALEHLPTKLEVEVLFLVAVGHHIADFRVGKERQVGLEVFIGLDVLVEGWQTHVESDVMEVELHGMVCQSDIGEGRVEGMVVGERVELVGVEGRGVEEMWLTQCYGVEIGRVEGHQGGVGDWLLAKGWNPEEQCQYGGDGFFHSAKIIKIER